MRLVTFDDYRVGALEPDGIHDLTGLLGDVPPSRAPYRMNALIAGFDALRDHIEARRRSGPVVALDRVQLRAPSPMPRSFLGAPINYRAHGSEMTGPIATGAGSTDQIGYFVKAGGSLSGPSDGLLLPDRARRFDYEAEVGVVIGREARGVSRDDALGHVFGYTLVIDGTMRMTETEREERTMRKSFWGLNPSGPCLVTADEVPDPSELTVRLWLNDELRQEGHLSDLIVDVPGLVALGSQVTGLEPGDLIATGTPAGVATLSLGDEVRIACDPIGEMRLPVGARGW